MDWKRRVVEMGVLTRNDDDEGRQGTFGVLERADVVWAAWSDDGQTPAIRVVRGRDLTGPALRHGVLLVESEAGALDPAETHGEVIGLLDDGKTLDIPEPAVPPHLIDLVMTDPVMFHDGAEMDFAPLREAERA
ncbi:hypothetical protein [Methylobacterium aquaticum]|uniref:hypothetical protein n=1 Tax=Methylobacterium aquaticum TaxID=270351 RepID=UPI001932A95D|nr:hypothetical protein [Methylobacterium aquaticum]QRE77244.1 hypothetical protein F1D61_30215 [Methylobacterium aquaticum]